MRCTRCASTPARSMSVAAVCRRSWKRIGRGIAFGHSFASQAGSAASRVGMPLDIWRSPALAAPARVVIPLDEPARARARRSTFSGSHSGDRIEPSPRERPDLRDSHRSRPAGRARARRDGITSACLPWSFRGVRAAYRDHPSVEVDVGLAESAQLALAKARVDGGRSERPPERRNMLQHSRDLFHSQRRVHPLGNPPRFGLGDRVRADPKPHFPRLEEHGRSLPGRGSRRPAPRLLSRARGVILDPRGVRWRRPRLRAPSQ